MNSSDEESLVKEEVQWRRKWIVCSEEESLVKEEVKWKRKWSEEESEGGSVVSFEVK